MNGEEQFKEEKRMQILERNGDVHRAKTVYAIETYSLIVTNAQQNSEDNMIGV